MVLELTKENLQKLDYSEDEINRMLNAKEDCSLHSVITKKYTFISKTENKFYTGIDYWRAWHFKSGTTIFPARYPEFFEEYFNITLNEFLEKQKAQLIIHFEEKIQFNKFLLIEIKKCEEIIKGIKGSYKSFSSQPLFGKGDKGKRDVYAYENYIQFLDNKLFINSKQDTSTVVNLTNNLDFNKNHWNEKTFNLFNYLIGNYEKTGNVKYINIYKFLKSMNVKGYAFTFKQDDYRIFILSSFNVKITKFAVANYKYDDIELPILSSLEEDFRKQTK